MRDLGNYIIILFFFLLFMVQPHEVQAAVQSDSWQELYDCNPNTLAGIPIKNSFPDVEWWKQFNDENLNKYISNALSDNFSLKAATARIAQARAIVEEVKSVQRPFASLQGSYERTRVSSSQPVTSVQGKSFSLYTFPLQASYELDVFGKNRLKIESAKKLEKETEQERQVIELAISSEVAGAYFNLLQADALIKSTEALIDNTSQSVQIRHQLFAGGVIPYDMVFITEQDLATYRENLAQYKSQRAIFAHQLSILTGIKPIKEQQIARSTLDNILLPSEIPVGVPSEIVTHRPDVKEVELTLERANINVKEARREFFPDFNLSGYFGYSSSQSSKIFNWRSHIFQIAPTAIQTLYTGGYKKANLKYQKAVIEETLNNYYSVLLSAFGDVENSLALFKDNYCEYQQNLFKIASSERYTEMTQARYNSGVGNRIDFLDAQRQLLTYQLLSKQNKAKSLVDLVSLYKSLGGGR